MAIKKGNKIKVEYEGRFEDGNVFDSSSHGDHSHPLEFEIGLRQVISGFEKNVIGMEIGEEREFSILPEEGYGKDDKRLKKDVPRSSLPKNQDPKLGMILIMRTPEEHQIPVKITKVGLDIITIDLNHPLAGKKLIFKIKIIDIK